MFVTTILTAVGLLVLVFLPDSVYIGIFGSDFVGLSSVIRFIIPGIFSISLNIILSHFFSGTGRILFNLIGSAIGLFVVATAGYILINGGKLADAALVSSIGYFSNFVFAAISFFVINGGIKLSVKKGKAIFTRK
jgi:O-antigen/teichoic acid export membrane protein